MAGILALTQAELRRLLRNRRYFVLTIAFPVILYLFVGKQVKATAYGVQWGSCTSWQARARPSRSWPRTRSGCGWPGTCTT